MSRVGKKPIPIPDGVKVEVEKDKVVVEGPLGKLEQFIVPMVEVKLVEENGQRFVVVERENETKKAKSFHGLMRSLINNMVVGVSKGFEKILVVQGIGYRANMQGKNLVLNVGYSNPVVFEPPEGIKIEVTKEGKIKVFGIDKQKVGQVAANIRAVRKPEPYKGKGIRYENEIVRIKETRLAKK